MGLDNFLESKVLALSVMLLGLDALILGGSAFLPFWFKLHISPEDATYGSEGRRENYVIQSGLFFMSTDQFTDMIFMGKINNSRFAPKTIIAAQLLYFTGTLGIVACFAAAFILACRRLGSVVGQFFLGGFATASSVCCILGVVLSSCVVLNVDDTTFTNLPMNNPRRLANKVKPTAIDVDWGFYIAIIGAALSIGAAILTWIEAFKTCRYVEDIRQKQLVDPRYGKDDDVPYSRFQYQQSYPDTYAVTVPSHRPQQQQYYGEPETATFTPGRTSAEVTL